MLEIDCRSVADRLKSGDDLVLLDCRERDEHALVKIEGAQLMPMSEMQARVEELAGLRDRDVVIYCHHGSRSLQVAVWLAGQGFGKVKSLSGGIDRWAVEVDPTLPRY